MAETEQLCGWGRTPRSNATVRQVLSANEIQLTDGVRGQIARGLGRGYGDAALNAGGLVWDTTALRSLEIDGASGLANVGAGVSYLQILDAGVPEGLFPPVTPGTKFVTMGGAIAADVHGKNHHRDGSIGHHIETLTMLTGNGEVVETKLGEDLFEATFGGMGLTGIVLEAVVRLARIESPLMSVDTFRTEGLGETLDTMTTLDEAYQYSVSWVDLCHRSRPGRGVITLANHSSSSDVATFHTGRPLAAVPDIVPSGLVTHTSVRGFNEFWYRKAPQERRDENQTIEQFFYPLDIASNWNRVYGRSGFLQYQMVVPFGREDVLEGTVAAFQSAPAPPSLAVLKRLGIGRGLLSFPIEGWTLAVDFPAGRRELNDVLDRIDRRVADAGGRVYLAKDSRMQGSLVADMYPELGEWRELADKADPTRRFRSDLDRRLLLRGS